MHESPFAEEKFMQSSSDIRVSTLLTVAPLDFAHCTGRPEERTGMMLRICALKKTLKIL
jgi:hypothetical protein